MGHHAELEMQRLGLKGKLIVLCSFLHVSMKVHPVSEEDSTTCCPPGYHLRTLG
jgi:hypothetical protein